MKFKVSLNQFGLRDMSSAGSRVRLGLLVGAAGALIFSAPMLLSLWSSGPVIDSSKPLKPEAVRRGAFNNSGSKDIGPEYVVNDVLLAPQRRHRSKHS